MKLQTASVVLPASTMPKQQATPNQFVFSAMQGDTVSQESREASALATVQLVVTRQQMTKLVLLRKIAKYVLRARMGRLAKRDRSAQGPAMLAATRWRIPLPVHCLAIALHAILVDT